MMRQTPRSALQTLDRELASVCDDVTRPGSMLGNRIDAIRELLPMIVASVKESADPTERAAAFHTLEALHARQARLSTALSTEITRLQDEMSQLATGARAVRSYGTGATTPARLDYRG
jgi:hypothetical protein